MREILSKKHNIQFLIMTLFLEHDELTLAEIEEYLGVSAPTLKTYLQELEQETNFFQLQRRKNLVCLVKTHRTNYSAICHFFYQESVQLKFIETVFLHPFVKTEEILKKMHISKSTLNRIQNHLQEPLKRHNISISDSPFHFEGNFQSVCAFIVFYMYEKYDFLHEFINQQENEHLDRLVEPFCKLPQIEGMQDEMRLKVWIWSIIKLCRHYPEYIYGEKNNEYQFSGFIMSDKQFEAIFSIKFHGFCYSTVSKVYAYLERHQLTEVDTRKKQAVRDFVDGLYDHFGENTRFENSHTIEKIFLLYSGRNYILNNEKERFVVEFFQRNSCFSQETAKVIELGLKKLKNEIQNHYLYFELLYILLTHEKRLTHLLINRQEEKKVAVLYTYDKEHSHLVASRLGEIFEHYLEFIVIEELDPPSLEEVLKEYDFCITNLSTINQEQVIVTDIFPNDGDIEYLDRVFRKSINQPFVEELKRDVKRAIKG